MNVLDLYRDDVDGRLQKVGRGGRRGEEWRGPCPVCGGDDRFGVWPEQNGGTGSYFCGHGHGGNGCGIGGDRIQYLRDARNYSYAEACECLGIEVNKGGGAHMRYELPPSGKRAVSTFSAQQLGYPEEVVDGNKWHEHGMKFVDACHEALLNRPTSIAYLMARGIDRSQIEKYKLGFHAGEIRDEKQYQPSFRPWPSWGLRDEKKQNGRSRMLVLPAGIVIPYIVDGRLHRITIRLIKPDPQQPKKKYHYVKGSIRDVWVSNPQARAFVTQEAELDCIAIDGAAGDLVGTIGLGSTGVKPDARADSFLRSSLCILGGLDFDAPRLNERTGEYERPGAVAGVWWQQQYQQYRRWPVPKGKDAGEAFEQGVNLRLWIMAGLPPVFHTANDVAKQETATPRQEVVAERMHEMRVGDIIRRRINTNDVVEFKELLREADGFVRIYDKGCGVGIEVDGGWRTRFPEKRRRLSELLFNSEEVAYLIDNLADGNYRSVSLPG